MDVPPESHTWELPRHPNHPRHPRHPMPRRNMPRLLSLPRASVLIEPTGVEGLTIASSPVNQAEFFENGG